MPQTVVWQTREACRSHKAAATKVHKAEATLPQQFVMADYKANLRQRELILPALGQGTRALWHYATSLRLSTRARSQKIGQH